jgi:hypothetical protein
MTTPFSSHVIFFAIALKPQLVEELNWLLLVGISRSALIDSAL